MGTAPKRRDLYERLDRLGIEWLCDKLIGGESLRAIARELDASATAIQKWVDREPGRMRQYQLARQAQADALIDGLIDIADEPVPVGPDGRMDSAAVNDKRLRIDARKWIASKFRPGIYGDKVTVDGTMSTGDQKPEQIMERIVGLLAAHGLSIMPATASSGDAHE
jgi:hypothetical protein